jgi:DNA-binding transcriptional LysR family regulator
VNNLLNISLKQLQIFVTIVECGNFTQAGRKLYLAQSTVSSHISALEQALQVSLFRRESKRTIELTADGKRVYKYAKDVVAKCVALEHSVTSEVRRNLIIGASSAPAKSILPRYVMDFSTEHPECNCIVRAGDSEHIQQLVLSGDIQIGFVGSTDNRQSLTYERIADDHLVMITPNTARFAKMKADGLLGRDLLDEPMVFRDQGSGTQKMIDNYLSSRELDAKDMQVRYYVSDPDMLQELVVLGAGVSIQSARTVEAHVRDGKLLTFELEEQPVHRPIYMVYHKKSTLSELAMAFADMVRRSA